MVDAINDQGIQVRLGFVILMVVSGIGDVIQPEVESLVIAAEDALIIIIIIRNNLNRLG